MGKVLKFIILSIFISILIFIFIVYSPYIFVTEKPGDVSEVKELKVKSEMYSQKDIKQAMKVVEKNFKQKINCKLQFIKYIGDKKMNFELESIREEEAWMKKDGVWDDGDKSLDEIGINNYIVLEGSFKTGNFKEPTGFNENYTYRNWTWTLTRKSGEKWKVKNQGLC